MSDRRSANVGESIPHYYCLTRKGCQMEIQRWKVLQRGPAVMSIDEGRFPGEYLEVGGMKTLEKVMLTFQFLYILSC